MSKKYHVSPLSMIMFGHCFDVVSLGIVGLIHPQMLHFTQVKMSALYTIEMAMCTINSIQ